MPVQNARPGSTVLQQRYRIGARIAAGGMGTVHRGWDQRLDRPVAVKLLHPHLAEDLEVRTRFHAEARHAARVRHPNVVAVLDADEHHGQPFIVMELIDGPSLRDLLTRRTRLTPAELLRLLTAACAGLDAIHEADLVHRDIKPENLLHDKAGRLRVADFGISRALDSTRLTPAGTLLGSVQYMAPEVVLGSAAIPASDQYSLGIVAFEALTGQTPLPAEVPLAIALRHAHERVPAPSTVVAAIDAGVDRVVTTATARDPEHRFASLEALVAALRAAIAGPTHVTTAARRPRTALLPVPHTPTRRRPARAPAAVQSRPATAPPAQRPIYIRARMSALALLSLAFTLVQAGMVVAPLLGLMALRRIDRSHGTLRGEAVAGLAILVGLARLAHRLMA